MPVAQHGIAVPVVPTPEGPCYAVEVSGHAEFTELLSTLEARGYRHSSWKTGTPGFDLELILHATRNYKLSRGVFLSTEGRRYSLALPRLEGHEHISYALLLEHCLESWNSG